MKWILLLLLLISFNSHAQYPFEKYPAIKYDTVSFKIIQGKEDYSNVAVARYKDYRIELLEKRLKDSINFLLYFKDKLIKKMKGDDFVSTYLTDPLYIADINHDGLLDFKIIIANVGAGGLASSLYSKIYLFNEGNNRFRKIEVFDFFENQERDMGGNGRYEMIGQSLDNYKGHNYWLFNIYNYKNGRIVNVSKRYNYPIAVPYLFNETFKPTNKISKRELVKLSLKERQNYSIN